MRKKKNKILFVKIYAFLILLSSFYSIITIIFVGNPFENLNKIIIYVFQGNFKIIINLFFMISSYPLIYGLFKLKKWAWLYFIINSVLGFLLSLYPYINYLGLISNINIFSLIFIFYTKDLFIERKDFNKNIGDLVFFVTRSKEVIFDKIEEAKKTVINNLELLDKEMDLKSVMTFSNKNFIKEWVMISGVFRDNKIENLIRNYSIIISIYPHEFYLNDVKYNLKIVFLKNNYEIKSLREINFELIKDILDSFKNDKEIKLKKINNMFNKSISCSNQLLIHRMFCRKSHNFLNYKKYGIQRYIRPFKRFMVFSANKPLYEPRYLVKIDSWQAVIPQLENNADSIKNDLFKILNVDLIKNAVFNEESIWYFGLYGKIEKPQLIINSNRGVIFIQIHKYGNSLYISWQSYINKGQWKPYVIGNGYSKEYDRNIILSAFKPSIYFPNEYDLQDLVCLSEWIHSQITKILRIAIKENKIDQEIDFKISKGSRDNLLNKKDNSNYSIKPITINGAQKKG